MQEEFKWNFEYNAHFVSVCLRVCVRARERERERVCAQIRNSIELIVISKNFQQRLPLSRKSTSNVATIVADIHTSTDSALACGHNVHTQAKCKL